MSRMKKTPPLDLADAREALREIERAYRALGSFLDLASAVDEHTGLCNIHTTPEFLKYVDTVRNGLLAHFDGKAGL